jgi:hypothetical protein
VWASKGRLAPADAYAQALKNVKRTALRSAQQEEKK